VNVEEARQLDASDPLAFARERFRIPDNIIYLDGNSLGALPAAAPAALAITAEQQWGEDLIASWTRHAWIDSPVRIASKLAPIVGAKANELLIADSTSVCLFKLLAAAVRARPGRRKVVSSGTISRPISTSRRGFARCWGWSWSLSPPPTSLARSTRTRRS
jgi:kynureninase